MTDVTLTPGDSTVGDAADAYGVTIIRILRVLRDCGTDVYTPDTGRAAVVSHAGRKFAFLTGEGVAGIYGAAGVYLGADSIDVLARYIGRRRA